MNEYFITWEIIKDSITKGYWIGKAKDGEKAIDTLCKKYVKSGGDRSKFNITSIAKL